MFGKHVAANKALKIFINCKTKRLSPNKFIRRKALDSETPLYSHMEWTPASEKMSLFLNSKVKEPTEIVLMEKCLYKFTENQNGKYNQSQLGYLYKLPSIQQIENFEPFDIYVGPVGLHSIDKDFESEHDLINNG